MYYTKHTLCSILYNLHRPSLRTGIVWKSFVPTIASVLFYSTILYLDRCFSVCFCVLPAQSYWLRTSNSRRIKPNCRLFLLSMAFLLQFSFFLILIRFFFYRKIQLSNCDVHLKWKWRWSTEFMRILCLFFITCNVTLFNFVKSFYLHRKFSSIFTWILFHLNVFEYMMYNNFFVNFNAHSI